LDYLMVSYPPTAFEEWACHYELGGTTVAGSQEEVPPPEMDRQSSCCVGFCVRQHSPLTQNGKSVWQQKTPQQAMPGGQAAPTPQQVAPVRQTPSQQTMPAGQKLSAPQQTVPGGWQAPSGQQTCPLGHAVFPDPQQTNPGRWQTVPHKTGNSG
jgi:hypothetical protein